MNRKAFKIPSFQYLLQNNYPSFSFGIPGISGERVPPVLLAPSYNSLDHYYNQETEDGNGRLHNNEGRPVSENQAAVSSESVESAKEAQKQGQQKEPTAADAVEKFKPVVISPEELERLERESERQPPDKSEKIAAEAIAVATDSDRLLAGQGKGSGDSAGSPAKRRRYTSSVRGHKFRLI